MIDPKLIRHETQIVLDSLSKRKNDFNLDDYLLAEKASRKIQTEKLKLSYNSLKDLLVFVEQEYLNSAGEFYINSINNRTN